MKFILLTSTLISYKISSSYTYVCYVVCYFLHRNNVNNIMLQIIAFYILHITISYLLQAMCSEPFALQQDGLSVYIFLLGWGQIVGMGLVEWGLLTAGLAIGIEDNPSHMC